jgi:2-polyprenyl-3-methyl-5-hydroxy-6-metoxy-1,4-benzoquinol methylase
MAGNSSSSLALAAMITHHVQEKVSKQNHATWKAQVLATIRGARIEGFLIGNAKKPEALIEEKEGVTPSFKAKTECIHLYVQGSSFTYKVTNSEINSITSVYYIVSYYKNLLHVQNGLSSGK